MANERSGGSVTCEACSYRIGRKGDSEIEVSLRLIFWG